MKIILFCEFFLLFLAAGCKQADNKITLPDLRSNFSILLMRKDSTLSLDSFYFLRMDTMTEKSVLIHQRFPFYNILGRIEKQLERMSKGRDSLQHIPSASDIQNIDYLNGEKVFVGKEIDSLNRLILTADSVTAVGYRAFYKVTVNKKGRFIVSDTIPYAISLKMNVSDWDRNLEKNIDSLAVGSHLHRRGDN